MFCSKKSDFLEKKLASFLPESNEIEGWHMNNPPEEYKGEDLFLYINGGAEIYHEYGFKQVLIQDYINDRGSTISLEIYEMLNYEAAFGIYSFKRSIEGQALNLGGGGRLEGYYLNFWENKYLVTLTGFDEESETVQGLLIIAKAVDAILESNSNSKKPSLIHLLPEKDLIEPSVKYFRGNLGLFNCYPFSTKNIFELKEGIRGKYQSGYEVFIIKYINEIKSQEIFSRAQTYFEKASRYHNFNTHNLSFQVKDDKNVLIDVNPHKNYIIIILGAKNFPESSRISKKVRNQIQE